jgi:FkbM family methyltransferase
MKRFEDVMPEDIGGGINLLDLGASGQPPAYWARLAPLINLIGLDPNRQECERLTQQKTGYHRQRFLPYAVAGKTGEFTLHRTHSIYCWSLLPPDLEWLRRFTFADLFEVDGAEQISAFALDDIPELQDVEIDAMKLDTQGLELPILRSAEPRVDRCILIETETGLCQNYREETTFDQIMQFMLQKGFGLFDINTDHRIPRTGHLAPEAHNEQMLWCEAVWMRDFVKRPPALPLTREKALKALYVYANHGCYSFGAQMATYFHERGLLTPEELAQTADVSFWKLRSPSPSIRRRFLKLALQIVPRPYHHSIVSAIRELEESKT